MYRIIIVGMIALLPLFTFSQPGINCWDLNGNRVDDPGEDINMDGLFNAEDCRGEMGLPGLQGPAGLNGLNGLTGADGIDGINGINGLNGTNGINGTNGNDGISCWDLNGNAINDTGKDKNGDGVFNSADCQGSQGLIGPQGIAGLNGTNGQDGAQGQQGEQGIQGLSGPQGDIGPAGKSAYEIWRDLGNIGTEEDFIQSILTSANYSADVQSGTYEIPDCCCPSIVDLSTNINLCNLGTSMVYAENEINGSVIMDGDGTALVFFTDSACSSKETLTFDLVVKCADGSEVSAKISITSP